MIFVYFCNLFRHRLIIKTKVRNNNNKKKNHLGKQYDCLKAEGACEQGMWNFVIPASSLLFLFFRPEGLAHGYRVQAKVEPSTFYEIGITVFHKLIMRRINLRSNFTHCLQSNNG